MIEIGVLEKRSSGSYVQTDACIQTGNDIHDTMVYKFQVKMLEEGLRALSCLDVPDREIQTLTFGIPEAYLPKLKGKIRTMIQDLIHDILEHQRDADSVYQLNVELFPHLGEISKRGV